jgi:hypothetical protein
MIPTILVKELYPEDFLYIPTIPYLSDDEYLNIFDLVAHVNLRGVKWCIQVPMDAPYIDDLFMFDPKFVVTLTAISYEGKSISYLTITNYPRRP